MKTRRLLIVLACSFGCTVDLSGPGGGGGGGGGDKWPTCETPSSLAFKPMNDTIDVGRGIAPIVVPTGGGNLCYTTWSVADTSVAYHTTWYSEFNSFTPVSAEAVVGRAPGTTSVSAEKGGLTATMTVHVVPPRDAFHAGAGGDGLSCALDAAGHPWCWGSEVGPMNPTRIPGDARFASMSVGRQRACGLTPQGVAVCWGVLGPYRYRLNPDSLALGWLLRQVSAGDSAHSCGIRSDSLAICWGDNADGQLGIGSGIPGMPPAPVAGGKKYVAVSAGGRHSCAIATDGAAWCWGTATEGQLGDGVYAERQAVPVPVSGQVRFTAISAGHSFTCALGGDALAYCWGANSLGQLGSGDTLWSATPRAVAGGRTFTSISAGRSLACALDGSGAAWCWGNTYPSATLTPTRVESGMAFTGVAVTADGACGEGEDGRLYCWGYTYGSSTGNQAPVLVPGQK